MFLGIILRALRLEGFIYNVYITNQFQTTFSKGGGGEESRIPESVTIEVTVNSKEENS